MAEDLEGLDLTPLVVPNLRYWSAMRASAAFYGDVVASPPSVMIEGAVGGVEFDPYRWHLDARMLSLVVGNWRKFTSLLKAGGFVDVHMALRLLSGMQ